MSAPTVKTKVTADTVDFDKSMKDVVELLKSAGGQMKSFASNASSSVGGGMKQFKESVSGMVDSLKPLGEQLLSVSKKVAKWGSASVLAAKVTGAAIIVTSLSSIKELKNLSTMADVSTASLQRGGFAAASVGVDMETYAQALKDVNDRLGDFAATKAGPMVDFFEQIGAKVGVTSAAFEGLNSEQSLGLYVKTLEDANVTQQEMTFYMEALAGDATKLIPLFSNNAKQMNKMKNEAKALGIGLSEIDVKQAMNAQTQLATIGAIIKNELMTAVVEIAPFITALGKHMITLFKSVKSETGGLAGVMQRFAFGVADYIDTIGTVFAYVGKGFDILSGVFNVLVGNIKIGVGAIMAYAGAIVQGTIGPLLSGIQFVTNAFNNGFGKGMTDTLKMLNLSIQDFLLYPIEKLFELLAKLPDDFGGELFKASLADIESMRKQTQDLKSDLTDEVMAPNVDIDTPMGQFNALFNDIKTGADDIGNNLLNAGGELIVDGFNQGAAGGRSIIDGLTSTVNSDSIKEALSGAMAAVQDEMINNPNAEGTKEDVPVTPVSSDAPKKPMATYASELEAFYTHTADLLEAEAFRFASENELLSSQYDTQIQMLQDKLATEGKLNETEEAKLKALKESSAKVHKDMAKEAMVSGIQMLLQGSSKASKIMKKYAIAQAIIKGKDAAVSAWSAGMSTGGPFAPVIAAAYTAASIARTAGMINAIKGGGSSSGGGGGAATAAVSAGQNQSSGGGGGQSAQSSPSRIFNVEFAGQSTTSTQQTRNLLELINEQAGDNVTINMRG
tara:strand:+ start:23735 stop:26095 length:2361 start_codon:yes stop_codon:yes gene_type:complete